MTFFLTESKRDDQLLPYVNLLREKGIKTNVSQLKQFLLRKFVNEGLFRNLSLHSNFYLVGVAKYYFNGDLTRNKILNVFDDSQTDEFIPEICERLNACILILRNAYIDSVGTEFEQPEDFGNLKLNALLRKYNKKIDTVLGIVTTKKIKSKEEEVIDDDVNVGNGYTFDILYSYADATKYKKYTEPGAWCITYGQHHYNDYIRKLGIHYVIIKQNGFENIPRRVGANWTKAKPQDEYGNSLIALLQSNKTGEPVFITSRWNHGASQDNTYPCEADHAYTKEEFFKVTGMNDDDLKRIQKIWLKHREVVKKEGSSEASVTKKNNQLALRYLKYGQMRLNGGESLDNVFPDASKKYLFGNYNDLKKTILGLAIPIEIDENTTKYAKILYVKGKLQFDSFNLENDQYLNRLFNSSTNKNDFINYHYNDLIIINYDKKYKMYYDIKRNCFVNVDGITKFKYTSWCGPSTYNANSCVFYEVAMSQNQRALIDYNTNKPLRLPNGEFWYEYMGSAKSRYWSSGNEVKVHEVYQQDKAIVITYDSASHETFYYDVTTRRFFNPLSDVDKEYRVHLLSGWSTTPSDLYVLVYSSANNYEGFRRIYKDGKPLEFDGEVNFKTIQFLGDNSFVSLKLLSNERKLYDFETKENIIPIDFTGAVVDYEDATVISNLNSVPEEFKNLVWIGLPNFHYTSSCLYDLKNKHFYLNPITGGYIFSTYSSVNYHNTLEVYERVRIGGLDRIIPNNRIKLNLADVVAYTKEHYSEAGSIPQSEWEEFMEWTKRHPEKVNSEIKNFIEYKMAENNNIEYKMAENKLTKNDMLFIINEAIKRIK